MLANKIGIGSGRSRSASRKDVIAEREEALAKQLAEMRRRKQKLDPLQFEMSIQAEDLTSYVPSFGWKWHHRLINRCQR